MEKNKDKKKKKVVESDDSSSDSGPEDVSVWIVNKYCIFFGPFGDIRMY
jgi:hypothetical protein